MKRAPTAALCALAVACAVGHADSRSPPTREAREIAVEDLVRYAVIGDPGSLTWNDRRNTVSTVSPDGQQTAVVVRAGNTKSGANEATLLLYRTAELLTTPRATVLARLASRSNYQPIAQLRWLADSKTLIFAGTQDTSPSQVYRVNTRTRTFEPLTHEPQQLLWFDITSSGHWLTTFVERPRRPAANDPTCRRRGCRVEVDSLYAVLYGTSEISAPLQVHDVRSGQTRTIDSPERTDDDLAWCENEIEGGLSPTGRYALRRCSLKAGRWPSWWAQYTVDTKLNDYLARGNTAYAREIVLADLMSGSVVTVPVGPYISAQVVPVWIEEDSRLVLAGALESLDSCKRTDLAICSSRRAILAFDPTQGRVERIGFLDAAVARVTDARWDDNKRALIVQMADLSGSSLPTLQYIRAGDHWQAAAAVGSESKVPANKSPSRIQLTVTQSLNDPPMLMAVNPRNGSKKPVLDPNPWLKHRTLGRVERVSWTSPDGRSWQGGLYFPPHFQRGVRYPLVLQTHGFRDDRFSLHGVARNFAAQPLAASEMMVLQVQEGIAGTVGTPAEWPAVQAGYEAAIDYLDQRGLIDRDRVGIVGWSRTGPHTGYTLTHSTYPFRAAAFIETADFGWWYYLSSGAMRELETNYGAPPFGSGLDRWQQLAPSFNLTALQTPMLMWAGDATGLWDWYAGLRRLGKPVEYWVAPDSTHDVFKVEERLTVNQLLVDWFRFWLNDEQDPDERKTAQYVRWRALRELGTKPTPADLAATTPVPSIGSP